MGYSFVKVCVVALSVLFATCLSGLARSSEAPILPGYKTAKPPLIDGIINPDEWLNVPSGKGGFDTQDGHPAPEPMQFWLCYDDEYIYFAARLSDHNPKAIHAEQYQTNVDLSGDDNVQLRLDLGGSTTDFNIFGMNAKGATSLSLAGGRAAKREWSGDFIAKGRITDAGWEVETRIPWQMMRLPSPGVRNVRFNVIRYLPRDLRSYAFVYAVMGHQNETPVWSGIPIPKQLTVRKLKLLPYAYAGYDQKQKGVFNSGLDLKTDLTDKITLVGTINPDFRNIENQILNLDFSRFERLATESRPFFQEGSQYMNSQLYASQRIESLDAGLNAYGHIDDKTSFGLIDTVRFGHEHDSVVNATYSPTPNDSYRVTGASLSEPGLQNTAYLARYSKQIGPTSLFLRSMGSQDSIVGGGQYETASLFYLKKEWNMGVEYDWASPNFAPRLGFVQEVDFKGFSENLGYDKVISKGPVSEAGVGLSYLDYTHVHGDQYRRHAEVDTILALRNRLQLTANFFKERFEGEDDHLWQTNLLFPRDDIFRNINIEYDFGKLALVPYTSLSPGITYRFGKKLQTNLRYQVVHHGDRQDQLVFTSSYDLGRDRSISGRVVKNNSDLNGYLSFRQSGNRGTEYYVILGDPNADRFRASLIVKVVYPIELILGHKPHAHTSQK